MVDFYYAHRHERYNEDGYYPASVLRFTTQDLLELKPQYDDYVNRKHYYDSYMDDLDESDDDVEYYHNPHMAYVEFQEDEFMERLGRKFFKDKSFVKRLESGEDINVSIYEWGIGEKDVDVKEKFRRKASRNKNLNMKLREVDEVKLYKSDFDAIARVKKEYNLTELETQMVFGLIFMSRMHDVRWCRIGTAFKKKGFYSSFDKYITPEEKEAVFATGLFESATRDKGKARNMIKQRYDWDYVEYLHIEDEYDWIYKNFDNKDEVIWTFKTTLENNKLNFSKLAKEALPNFKYKYCTVCGELFLPNNNKQKQCTECKEKYKKENARLRKQKQRAIEKGLLQPEEKKKKRLTKAERDAIDLQWEIDESEKDFKKLNEEIRKLEETKPWLC